MEDLHPPTHSSFNKNVLSNSKVQDNSRSKKHGLQGNRTNKPKTPTHSFSYSLSYSFNNSVSACHMPGSGLDAGLKQEVKTESLP